MKQFSCKRIGGGRSSAYWVDVLAIFVVALLISVVTFHPYYFGDELFPLRLAEGGHDRFIDVFNGMNSYKPRLLFNATWSAIASMGMPRAVPMVLNLAFLSAAGMLLYRLMADLFSVGRVAALLGVAVLITSRFAVILYYDYISGIIESLALLFFLGVLTLTLEAFRQPEKRTHSSVILLVVLAIALVFVHERYGAALLVMAGMMVWRAIGVQGHARLRLLVVAALMSAFPIALFFAATKILSVLPVTTGTGALPVVVGSSTIKVLVTYLLNVYLGFNFGHEWLMGSFSWNDPDDARIQLVLAAVFLCAWLLPWIVKPRGVSNAKEFSLIFTIGVALAAVASLPGVDRQEGRWMVPVAACSILMAACIRQYWVRIGLLCLLLLSNGLYFGMGSQNGIYNIVASHTVRDISTSLNAMIPGRRGLIVSDHPQDYLWAIGGPAFAGNAGDSGSLLCNLNIHSGTCLDPPSAENYKNLERYDFGLFPIRRAPDLVSYRLLSRGALALVMNPDTITGADVDLLGSSSDWSSWRWSGGEAARNQELVLRPGLVGTRDFDADRLRDRFIVYRAHAIDAGVTVPMRLQVNWSDSKGRFLGATITVVGVTHDVHNYLAILSAPPEAAGAQVYANLHEGARSAVTLDSIGLIRGL